MITPAPVRDLSPIRPPRLTSAAVRAPRREPSLRGLALLPEAVRGVIVGYKPIHSREYWPVVRGFVVPVAVAIAPTTVANARRLMSMTTGFVIWVWQATGAEPTAARVFTDANIRNYVAGPLADRSHAYRFDVTRQLGTMATLLTGTITHRLASPYGPRTAPASDKDLARHLNWAKCQTTTTRRRNANAILALAAGAGLTAEEIISTDVADIGFIDDVPFVTVHGPAPRQVPVHRTWWKSLQRAVDGREAGPIFAGYRSGDCAAGGIGKFISDTAPEERPSIRALRSWWIVTQLDAGVPSALVAELAGLANTTALDRYLPHTQQRHCTDYLEALIGAPGVQR